MKLILTKCSINLITKKYHIVSVSYTHLASSAPNPPMDWDFDAHVEICLLYTSERETFQLLVERLFTQSRVTRLYCEMSALFIIFWHHYNQQLAYNLEIRNGNRKQRNFKR